MPNWIFHSSTTLHILYHVCCLLKVSRTAVWSKDHVIYLYIISLGGMQVYGKQVSIQDMHVRFIHIELFAKGRNQIIEILPKFHCHVFVVSCANRKVVYWLNSFWCLTYCKQLILQLIIVNIFYYMYWIFQLKTFLKHRTTRYMLHSNRHQGNRHQENFALPHPLHWKSIPVWNSGVNTWHSCHSLSCSISGHVI